jgi:HlyD family secretion protein
MMRKRLLIPVLLLVVLGGGAIWYWSNQEAETPQDQLLLYGNIDLRLINLAFEASGRIAAMELSEGARVRSGNALARLDDRRLVLARDAAAAQVEAQHARLAQLEAGSRPEEIHKLQAELDAARIEAKNAARSAERVQDLKRSKLASPQQSDDSRTQADAARAKVRALEAGLALAEAGARKEEISAARATLAALNAELALAERNLQDAVLYAPADGVIQSRILEPGDMASPQQPVYTLALQQPLWARVYVGETELGRVKPGMPARVQSDSFPGKQYAGWVGYISPSAEFTPKAVQTSELRADLVYQVRIFVCNPNNELRLGMPVTVSLDLTAAPQTEPACAERE